MSDHTRFDARIASLLAAYADGAPTDVDAVAMARLAAAGRSGPGPFRIWLTEPGRGLGFAFLLLALLVAIVGGAIVGGRFLREPENVLTHREFVQPFVGLPPEGAVPSTPETGELVVSFGGRVDSLGGDFVRMWLYADGRLIWVSNLEGYGRANPAFGASEPTTAVIEQQLTPLGVEFLRSKVMESARILGPARLGEDLTEPGRPGASWYGGMAIGAGGQILAATWDDPQLPALLADPGSWLPAGAWADRRIGGFVPSRYYVCVSPDRVELLPERTKEVLRSKSTPVAEPLRSDCRDAVGAEDARAIVETIDPVGVGRERLRFELPGRVTFELLPVLPDGDLVCNCG